MDYMCENLKGKYAKDQIWKATIKKLKRIGDTIEAEIEGRGSSMYIIIGNYEYGRYICIPSWKIGSVLSELDDFFWNREQLERQMSLTDAITVAEGLRVISNQTESMA